MRAGRTGSSWLWWLVLASGVVPACGKDQSASNPVPVVRTVEIGGEDTVSLVVTGRNFLTTSVVRRGLVPLRTEYVSATSLRASYLRTELPGPFEPFAVVNPPPGGGVSSGDSVTYVVRPRPVPQLTALSQTFVPLNADSTVITLTGADFASNVLVYGFNQQLTRTVVSSRELRVVLPSTVLRTVKVDSIFVEVPPPGGGRSQVFRFEVRAPAPVITALRQASTTTGQPSFQVQIDGTGFLDASTVTVNGALRTSTRLSTGTLAIALIETELSAASTYTIAVTNAGPGGGTSNAVSFSVTAGTPVIEFIPANGATVGRRFDLVVQGTGFVPGATVRWNGSDRATTYLNSGRLRAVLTDADVAAAGRNTITVRSPVAGVPESNAVSLQLRDVSTGTGSSIEVAVPGMGIAWSRVTGRLYAVGRFQNRIVEIDPASGAILRTLAIGEDPDALAISDDATRLYVANRFSRTVQRIGLPSLTIERTIALSSSMTPYDLEVLPGQPLSFAVTGTNNGLPVSGRGPVPIYDDNVERPGLSFGGVAGGKLTFAGDPSTLYLFGDGSSSFSVSRIGVEPFGTRVLGSISNQLNGFGRDIIGANGRLYGTDGTILDAGRLELVGRFAGTPYSVLIDADLGRAYAMFSGRIAVYDMNSLALLGDVAIPQALGGPSPVVLPEPRMTRCGTDCIAWSDGQRVVIARSVMFAP